MSVVIDFRPDGTVQGMHRDSFSLGFLGDQHIERASDIRFNEGTQLWDLYIRKGDAFQLPPGGDGFSGYDAARRVEVEWLDHCRLHMIQPFSVGGCLALTRIREGRKP